MELSQDILKGIHEIGDAKQYSDVAFKELIELSFKILLSKSTEEKLLSKISLSMNNLETLSKLTLIQS